MPYAVQEPRHRFLRWSRREQSSGFLPVLPEHLAAREEVTGGWFAINYPRSGRDFRKIHGYLGRVTLAAEDPSRVLDPRWMDAAPRSALANARTSLNNLQANALLHSPLGPRIATLVERISLDLADIETCFNEPSPSHVGGHYAKEADVMSPHPLAHFHELSVDVLGDSLRLVDTLTRSSW